MNKKGFNLIGIGLILYCINVSLPFFGVSSQDLSLTFLPVSAIVSYLLIGLGIRKVNKYRNKYKTASVLFIVAACLIGVVSMFIPLLTKNSLDEIFDLYSKMMADESYNVSTTYMLYLSINLMRGLNTYLVLILLIEILACVGIFIFLSGMSYEKINLDHKKRLKKHGICSTIFNIVALTGSILLIHFYVNVFAVGLYDPYNDVRIILNSFAAFAIMPVLMVFAILTLVNKIKFIIDVFKTYSNRIIEVEDNFPVFEELI